VAAAFEREVTFEIDGRQFTFATWSDVSALFAIRFLAMFTIPLFVMDLINETRGEEYVFETAVETRRVAIGVAMMALVAVFAANQANAFIYFRF